MFLFSLFLFFYNEPKPASWKNQLDQLKVKLIAGKTQNQLSWVDFLFWGLKLVSQLGVVVGLYSSCKLLIISDKITLLHYHGCNKSYSVIFQ